MRRLIPILFAVQKVLLVFGYWCFRVSARRHVAAPSISWVVGPNEIASMVYNVSKAIPGSHSVSLSANSYYNYEYDSTVRVKGMSRLAAASRIVRTPLLLARLMTRAQGFVYVGPSGFLLDQIDRRRFEFAFIKKHGLRIVCYWTGSDIRSTRRMNELEARTGLANISTYIRSVNPVFGTDAHEDALREIARVADKYADAMFNNSTDHLSYLTSTSEPFLYLTPDEAFVWDTDKFEDLSRLVVTHASTSPIIKGTQLVRAAVAKLKIEGYSFDYVELIGVSHGVVMSELARTHIALNHFYGFNPTVFGMEALASQCVVMMSADETIETSLPDDANRAWMVTRNYEVYDNLKYLLDHPTELPSLARRGQTWAYENESRSLAGAVLLKTLNQVLDGTYKPPVDSSEAHN